MAMAPPAADDVEPVVASEAAALAVARVLVLVWLEPVLPAAFVGVVVAVEGAAASRAWVGARAV